MDVNSDSKMGESSQSSTFTHLCDSLAIDNSSTQALSVACDLCHRILNKDTSYLEAESVCGDCKFLLLEDAESTSPDVYRRGMPASRRRYDSSESIDSMFSQQFSQMITMARQSQNAVLENDNPSVDGDSAARSLLHTSSLTTPSGSGRWRRLFSDNESDGFDSLYEDSESNVSFSRYGVVRDEADMISYTNYEGESDVSVDGRTLFGSENFGHAIGGSGLESDTDIDPMNAGPYHWNSDDDGEEEQDGAEIEGIALEFLRVARAQLHGSSRLSGSGVHNNGHRRRSHEVENALPFRTRGRIQARASDMLSSFEELIEAREFDNILEHLADMDSSRQGVPAASASFLNNLPRITINEEDTMDSVACAICKDSFTIGTIVNQLPCFHLYHPFCILKWLNARNTCPLCRFELPTDDNDTDAMKRNSSNGRNETLRIHQHDDSVDDNEDNEPSQQLNSVGENSASVSANHSPMNRWLFLAAPIVSIVGISLMLWFRGGRYQRNHIPCRRDYSHGRWRWS